MRSYLPSVADANRMTEFSVAGTPAGTVVVRTAGLRVHGMTVTAGAKAPSAGELAVFCRPVVTAPAAGRLTPRQRRRIMSYPLVIRLMLAMTLMPDASYRKALARLVGLLADIPFIREWHVPTGESGHGLAAAGPAGPAGGPVLAGSRVTHRR